MGKISAIVGLGFGDEGKGSTVDHRCRSSTALLKTVVRHNGGGQAGHNVVTPQGLHHTFSQFGSGTFAGAHTFLSHHMIVNPLTLVKEATALERLGISNPFRLLSVDCDALVTSIYQVAANRIHEEARGDARHGSCGLGIGETVADSLSHPETAIRIRDLLDRHTLRDKLEASRVRNLARFIGTDLSIDNPNWKCLYEDGVSYYLQRYLDLGKKLTLVDRTHLKRVAESGDVIFEGAQGVLLDQDVGFHPHTTWSDCTFGNVDRLLYGVGINPLDVTRVGVLRSYMTRHGVGPMPTEFVGHGQFGEEPHNQHNSYQEGFRVGHFDSVLARYALQAVGPIDELAITCLDKLRMSRPTLCNEYRIDSPVSLKLQSVGSVGDRNGAIVNISPFWLSDASEQLAVQTELAQLLGEVKPKISAFTSPQGLAAAISESLGVSTTTCSIGPTWLEKISLKEFMSL